MCSFHLAQQPQVGLLKTATLGLPVAVLPPWLLTTATDTPAIRTTADATAAAVERIIIMVSRSYLRSRKKATIRRGYSRGSARQEAVWPAPGTIHRAAAGWARAIAWA